MSEELKFHAVIQTGDGGGTFVFFPFDMLESFGTTGKVRVSGIIDGVPYSGTLLKYGFPHHILGTRKSLRTQIGTGPGNTVMIRLNRTDGRAAIGQRMATLHLTIFNAIRPYKQRFSLFYDIGR